MSVASTLADLRAAEAPLISAIVSNANGGGYYTDSTIAISDVAKSRLKVTLVSTDLVGVGNVDSNFLSGIASRFNAYGPLSELVPFTATSIQGSTGQDATSSAYGNNGFDTTYIHPVPGITLAPAFGIYGGGAGQSDEYGYNYGGAGGGAYFNSSTPTLVPGSFYVGVGTGPWSGWNYGGSYSVSITGATNASLTVYEENSYGNNYNDGIGTFSFENGPNLESLIYNSAPMAYYGCNQNLYFANNPVLSSVSIGYPNTGSYWGGGTAQVQWYFGNGALDQASVDSMVSSYSQGISYVKGNGWSEWSIFDISGGTNAVPSDTPDFEALVSWGLSFMYNS